MNLAQSLLLSTQRKAAARICGESYIVRYYLYIMQVTNQEDDSVLLEVFRVTYSDKKPGKEWGKPHIADKPHVSKPFANLDALAEYLITLDYGVDSGWRPVEPDDTNGEEEEV